MGLNLKYEKNLFTLASLKEGEVGVINSIVSGWQAAKRLADLGLTAGTQIKIIRKAPISGPIQIEVKGSKLALGKGIASKILVKPLEK